MVGKPEDRVQLLNLRKERRRTSLALVVGAVFLIVMFIAWAGNARASQLEPQPVSEEQPTPSVVPVTLPGDEGMPSAYLVTSVQGSFLCTKLTGKDSAVSYTCARLPRN